MSGVDLKQRPIPPTSPIRLLDSDPSPRVYDAKLEGERYSVIVSRDRISRDDEIPVRRWHVSVAGEDEIPRWEHFARIVHAVRPGITFVVPMPPADRWLNVNPNVLHVWQMDDEPLEDQWSFEGRQTRDRVTAGRPA